VPDDSRCLFGERLRVEAVCLGFPQLGATWPVARVRDYPDVPGRAGTVEMTLHEARRCDRREVGRSRRMRILFSSNPMFGHVNTMLPLAMAADRAGHDVVFATGAEMTERIEDYGLATWAVGPAAAPSGAAADWIGYFLAAAEERASTLVPSAADWQPDIVVHEETELAGGVAALHVGARHVVHGLGVMAPLRIWNLFEPAIDRILQDEVVDARAAEIRDALYLDVCPPALQPPPGEQVWHRVQPLRHSAGTPAPDEPVELALDDLPYDRLAHLTLGTVFNDAAPVLETALDGLRRLPVNVVVTTGPDADPAALGPQPAHVVVEPYVPHSVLLAKCDVVVSQGGAGIMFGSLRHGLPQLVLPQGADQDINAEACVRSGAGLALGRPDVTAGAVADAVARLLDEPAFSNAAESIRAEIEATPDPDSVMETLTSRDRAGASSA
jgi:UDP:flavonoid glycosyltransferase YjiC (YdhE family)